MVENEYANLEYRIPISSIEILRTKSIDILNINIFSLNNNSLVFNIKKNIKHYL